MTRTDSKSALPEMVEAKKVDYGSPSSLTDALRSHDALVIIMGPLAPPDTQSKLLQTAADAEIPWVHPDEWSPDSANEALVEDEWSLAISASYGFYFTKREVTLFDDGEKKTSSTTWPQVGRAVTALPSLPIRPEGQDRERCLERFKNGHAHVSSFTISQEYTLESVLRVTQTSIDEWRVTREPSNERYITGIKAMKGGDIMGFARTMYSRVFYPDDSGSFEKTKGTISELLGLPKEDTDEATKAAVERSNETSWSS
ncbi:hypothetical protein MMC17_008982 [Xylographa soralifera]|nr:hypothetical protein [Xylographa soralifera]